MKCTCRSRQSPSANARWRLEGQADGEGPDKGRPRVKHANHGKQHPQDNDEVVVVPCSLVHLVALEFDVEVAGPNEGQHGAGEAADEAHQDGEVRNGSSHQHCADNHGYAECKAPHLREISLRS